jgi:VWFA-related protein
MQLPDGTVLPLHAIITRAGMDAVESKDGKDPTIKGDSVPTGHIRAAAGAGVQGAVLGGIFSGPRGALYGAAAGGTATIIQAMLRQGPDLDLPRNMMFEARFEKPLDIPAKSVLAQNAPPAASPGSNQASDRDAPLEEPFAKARPVLSRPQYEQPIEAASASNPEPHPEPVELASVLTPESGTPAPSRFPTENTKAGEADAVGLKISVKVKMVQVDAVVRDRSGRIMDGLQSDDFRVYEDNVLQELAGFSLDELPLAVALVIDRSGSVAPYISELRRIANRALDNLKPRDQVCLFSFAENVQRMEDLTSDRQRIADSLDRIQAGGLTNIMDALHDAARYLAQAAPDHRHAIILVSDNQQTVQPRANEQDVITTAQETDTVVYSMKTSKCTPLLGNLLPTLVIGDSVDRVAKETGGEVIKVADVSSLDDALRTVISHLRTSYSLGYYPPAGSRSGAFHAITVRLDDRFGKAGKDYSILAKRGYYAVQASKRIAEEQHFTPAVK